MVKRTEGTPPPLLEMEMSEPRRTRSSLDTFNPIGFMGYRLDPVTRCYILGNGYRLYNPVMRAFYSPDSESPFGKGGINRYQYCYLDPINLYDPTGHYSGWAIGGIILGVLGAVIGIAFAIPTGGASLSLVAAGAAVIGTAVGAAAVGTGIASLAYSASDPEYADKLGKISFGLGAVSLAVPTIATPVAPATAGLSGGSKLLAALGGMTELGGGTMVIAGAATENQSLVKAGAITFGVGVAIATLGIAPAAISRAIPKTSRMLVGPRPAVRTMGRGHMRDLLRSTATGTKYQPPGLSDASAGILSRFPFPRLGI